VDYRDIEKHGKVGIGIADDLLTQPSHWSDHFRDGLAELLKSRVIDEKKRESMVKNVRMRFIHLPKLTPIRELRSHEIGTLITFEGLVRQVSQTKPKLLDAVFICRSCATRVTIPQTQFKLREPGTCSGCNARTMWEIMTMSSRYMNVQYIQVQEFHEGLRAAEQPYAITVELQEEMCNTVNSGFRVVVNGILKAEQKHHKDLIVEPVVHAWSLEMGEQSYSDIVISSEDEKTILELSRRPDILDAFSSSIAPSIFGHQMVKKAITLQLMGGVVKQRADIRVRGDIHVLLLGDPGVAKSQLLEVTSRISPRGVRASGTSSSKAGLTAAAVKGINDEWMLEAGALVLADMGLCAIDELDKMGEEDRKGIHTAMEQQKIDFAKAGLNTTLLTRCSILGAGNPKAGRWDNYASIADQINMSPTLLSRFDLIFIVKDVPDESLDDEIAEHILNDEHEVKTVLDTPMMRKYIAYAKKNCVPKLSPEANLKIKEYYTRIRGSQKEGGPVPITHRKLEDLKRLTAASARLRLSAIAEERDAQTAINIVDACLREVAYDAKTGNYDIDMTVSAMSFAQRRVGGEIRHYIESMGGKVSRSDIYTAMMVKYPKMEIDTAIEKMSQATMIVLNRNEVRLL